jgi:hypothetical protein
VTSKKADADNILTCALTFSVAGLRTYNFSVHQYDLLLALNVLQSEFCQFDTGSFHLHITSQVAFPSSPGSKISAVLAGKFLLTGFM